MKTPRICDEPDCERTDIVGRGLCNRHYQDHRLNGTLPTEPPMRPCEQCNKQFNHRKWNARFCSYECQDRAASNRKLKGPRVENCQWCEKSLEGKRHHARFCSDRCGDAWRNAQRSAEKAAAKGPCEYCGTQLPLGKVRYCTPRCKSLARRAIVYDLTQAELKELLDAADVCDICLTDEWGPKGKQVDHNHATGQVRGVLCMFHNTMIGKANEDPNILRAAICYLEHWNMRAEADKLAAHPNWPVGLDPQLVASLRCCT